MNEVPEVSNKETKQSVLQRSIENLASEVSNLRTLVNDVKSQPSEKPSPEDEKSSVYSLASLLQHAPESLDSLGIAIRECVNDLRQDLF